MEKYDFVVIWFAIAATLTGCFLRLEASEQWAYPFLQIGQLAPLMFGAAILGKIIANSRFDNEEGSSESSRMKRVLQSHNTYRLLTLVFVAISAIMLNLLFTPGEIIIFTEGEGETAPQTDPTPSGPIA